MNLGVVGSRNFDDYEKLKTTLDLLESQYHIGKIISGGAKGADQLAEKWAHEKCIPCEIYLPEWERYGKAAGIFRNKKIVSASDGIVAFWDGESKGTKNSIDLADTKNKLWSVIRF